LLKFRSGTLPADEASRKLLAAGNQPRPNVGEAVLDRRIV